MLPVITMSSLEQMAVRWALSSACSTQHVASRAAHATTATSRSRTRGVHTGSSSILYANSSSSRHVDRLCKRYFASNGVMRQRDDVGASPEAPETSPDGHEQKAQGNVQPTSAAVEEYKASHLLFDERSEQSGVLEAGGQSSSAGQDHDMRTSGSAAETSTQESTQSDKESALEQLFPSREDFQREHADLHRLQRNSQLTRQQNQTMQRSSLGSILRDDNLARSREVVGYESAELNREWGSDTESFESKSPTTAPRVYGKRDPRSNRSGSQMTPKEQNLFRDIFQRVIPNTVANGDDAGKNRLTTSFPNDEDEQPFASWMEGAETRLKGGDSSYTTLYNRNVSERDRRQHRASTQARRTLALLGEGPAASTGISTEELEAGVDRAREEVSACQTVQEVWDWARKNVWPVMHSAETSASDKQETDVKNIAEAQDAHATDEATKPTAAAARFGITTPFYASALHILHTQLRERFRAPHSALAVLRVARQMGPESLVLGCTPGLYEAAFRTSWTVLHDLEGTYRLVVEARESGILTGDYNAKAEQASRVARSLDVQHGLSATGQEESGAEIQQDSEMRIAKLLDTIRAEVYREVSEVDRITSSLSGSGASTKASGTRSALRDRQLFLAQELTRLAPMPQLDDRRGIRASRPRSFASSFHAHRKSDALSQSGRFHRRWQQPQNSRTNESRFSRAS